MLQILRAEPRAIADPYTGKQAAIVWRVSLFDGQSKRYVHAEMKTGSTFVTGDPAMSFSRKTGIAMGPKAGVAFKHDLETLVGESQAITGAIMVTSA